MNNSGAFGIAGCGYIGRALAVALAKTQRADLWACSRRGTWDPSPQEALALSAPCPIFAQDLRTAPQPAFVQRLAKVSTLVLSYAPGRDKRPADRSELYLGAPTQLLPHLSKGARVIALSSTSALPDLDLELNESCALPPTGPRGQLQRSAEDALWKHASELQLDLVILRLAGIYGPGRALTRLYGRQVAEPRPGDGHVATNLIHRDDVVAAIIAASQVPGPIHRLFHVCTDAHPSRRTMIDWAHTSQGLAAPAWSAAPGQGPVRGKRVSGVQIRRKVEQGGLGLTLLHPSHAPPPR